MVWVLLVLFYGVAKGVRDACKKKAIEKSGLAEVIFLYTLLSFLLVIPFSGQVFGISWLNLLWIFLKSSVIFVAWLLSFSAISRMPISLFGVMDMSGVLFSVLFAVAVLGETLGLWQIIGLVLVLAGLFLVSRTRKSEKETVALPVLLAMLASCLLSAVSGTMDKLLMRTGEITSGQLQFWYLFFLTAMYLVFILVKRVPVRPKMVVTNLWIPAMAVLFVLSDRALFIANADPSSKLAVMTVLKQSAGFVSVLIGKFFFREEGVWKRLACGALILCGIVISLL
ncbi:MAG: DMT family transporter [Clostridia bacterium]|nr:DMT family transporter [Clostridia bacterium]